MPLPFAVPAFLSAPPAWVLPALGGWAFGQLQGLGTHSIRHPYAPHVPRAIAPMRGAALAMTPAGVRPNVKPGTPSAAPTAMSGWYGRGADFGNRRVNWRRRHHHHHFQPGAPGAPIGMMPDPPDDSDSAGGWFLPALGGFAANQVVHWAANHWDGSHETVPVTSGRFHMWGLRRPGVVGPRGMERRWYHQPIRRSWTWLWTTGAMLSPRLRLKARKIVHLVQTKDPKGAQAVKILNDRVLAGGPEASTAQTLLDMVRRMAGI